MTDIKNIGTEQRNEKTKDLDLLSTMDILKIMNEEDLNVVAGVKKALPQIEKEKFDYLSGDTGSYQRDEKVRVVCHKDYVSF